jgi:hypothetical protein
VAGRDAAERVVRITGVEMAIAVMAASSLGRDSHSQLGRESGMRISFPKLSSMLSGVKKPVRTCSVERDTRWG